MLSQHDPSTLYVPAAHKLQFGPVGNSKRWKFVLKRGLAGFAFRPGMTWENPHYEAILFVCLPA